MAENAIERGEKQRSLHDRLQNDRIDTIANLSDSAAKNAEKEAKLAAANAAIVDAQRATELKRAQIVAKAASADIMAEIKSDNEKAAEKAAKQAELAARKAAVAKKRAALEKQT